MKATTKFSVAMYESLTEQGSAQLKGGFSASFAVDDDDDASGHDSGNNCLGGNCTIFCGDGQNIKCNVTAGCS